MSEAKNNIKIILIALFIYIVIIGFIPFMSIDSGIRCITTPCPTEVSGGLFKYLDLWRVQGEKPHVFDTEYYIPGIIFILMAGITSGFISKRKS